MRGLMSQSRGDERGPRMDCLWSQLPSRAFRAVRTRTAGKRRASPCRARPPRAIACIRASRRSHSILMPTSSLEKPPGRVAIKTGGLTSRETREHRHCYRGALAKGQERRVRTALILALPRRKYRRPGATVRAMIDRCIVPAFGYPPRLQYTWKIPPDGYDDRPPRDRRERSAVMRQRWSV